MAGSCQLPSNLNIEKYNTYTCCCSNSATWVELQYLINWQIHGVQKCQNKQLIQPTSHTDKQLTSTDILQHECKFGFKKWHITFLITFLYHLIEKRKKVKVCVWEPISELYGPRPAIWDHTVLPATWHRWTCPILTLAIQAGTWFTYPGGMGGWVDWNVYLSADSHPVK